MGNTKNNSKLDTERISNEARAWYIKNNFDGEAPSQTQTFREWLKTDQYHQEKYNNISSFMEGTEVYTNNPLFQEKYKTIIPHQAQGRATSVGGIVTSNINNHQPKQNTPLIRMKYHNGSIAALLFLFLIMTVTFLTLSNGESYQTRVGEQKTITLADGSKIKLNTNSKVTIEFRTKSRSITLDYGQAYFIVAKDKQRPFIVDFSLGKVTALGTEFDIYNKGPDVVISLVEGSVKVHNSSQKKTMPQPFQTVKQNAENITLEANDSLGEGEQIILSAQGASSIIKTDNKLINAWHSKQLIFQESKLLEVISEINRYSSNQVIIEDPDLSDEIISGVFPAHRDEAIEIIKNHLDLQTKRNAKGEILLERID